MFEEKILSEGFRGHLSATYPLNCESYKVDIDAIFICTRNRPHYLDSQLISLVDFEFDIFLCGTGKKDLDHYQSKYSKYANVHYFDLNLQTTAIKQLKCFSTFNHPRACHFNYDWDLYIKRNCILSFCNSSDYLNKIMIMDDDVGIPNSKFFGNLSKLADKYSIVGSFPENYPDLSVTRHIDRLSGGKGRNVFLSGNFLVINTKRIRSFFPPIYNEDWFFMVPYIENNDIAAYASIEHIAYDPFLSVDTLRFQEFGELIADGIFGNIPITLKETNSIEYWALMKSIRMKWIYKLKKQFNAKELTTKEASRMSLCLNASFEFLKDIEPVECSTFVANLYNDIDSINS